MPLPPCDNASWSSPIREAIASGKPFLGICLGLQLLFDVSYEDGEHEGLGVIPGEVRRFSLPAEYKVPHMGWNQVQFRRRPPTVRRRRRRGALLLCAFVLRGAQRRIVWWPRKRLMPTPFCSSVWRDNLFATQFHPEKSQAAGLQLLKNFAELGVNATPSTPRKSFSRTRTCASLTRSARPLPCADRVWHISCFHAHRTLVLFRRTLQRNAVDADLAGDRPLRRQVRPARQGDYQQETVFSDDPAAVARQFADQGARHLHLVDLDGARAGLPVNLPSVQEILAAIDMECELGGGIRDEQIDVASCWSSGCRGWCSAPPR